MGGYHGDQERTEDVKLIITFALVIFGAMVADANIYLAMLCIVAGLGVYCFAKPTRHSA